MCLCICILHVYMHVHVYVLESALDRVYLENILLHWLLIDFARPSWRRPSFSWTAVQCLMIRHSCSWIWWSLVLAKASCDTSDAESVSWIIHAHKDAFAILFTHPSHVFLMRICVHPLQCKHIRSRLCAPLSRLDVIGSRRPVLQIFCEVSAKLHSIRRLPRQHQVHVTRTRGPIVRYISGAHACALGVSNHMCTLPLGASLCLSMCVHMQYMYIYIYIYIHMVCVYVCYVCMLCMYVCMHVCVRACLCACVFVCM